MPASGFGPIFGLNSGAFDSGQHVRRPQLMSLRLLLLLPAAWRVFLVKRLLQSRSLPEGDRLHNLVVRQEITKVGKYSNLLVSISSVEF